MTVMAVVSSYDSYRVKVTHVSHYNYSTTAFLYFMILCMFHPKVLIIYFLIFVLCISLAISYALIMLFEVKRYFVFVLKSLNRLIYLNTQAPLVHLEKLIYYFLGIGKLPNVKRIKTE